MHSILQVASGADFELKSVVFKGEEGFFWCKVLTAAEARKIREDMFDKNQLSAKKAQARNEWMVQRCVFLDVEDIKRLGFERDPNYDPDKDPKLKRPRTEFVDDTGERRELVHAWNEKEVQAMKEPLLVKVADICDKVNNTKIEEPEEEALGN